MKYAKNQESDKSTDKTLSVLYVLKQSLCSKDNILRNNYQQLFVTVKIIVVETLQQNQEINKSPDMTVSFTCQNIGHVHKIRLANNIGHKYLYKFRPQGPTISLVFICTQI